MKRKLMAIICAASLVFSCGAVAFADETEGGGREGDRWQKDTYNVGITIQDLSNATWAAQVNEITKRAEEEGWAVTAVQHTNDPQKCVTQIENFTSNECDFIFIQSSAADAIKDTCKAAQEKGICIVGTGTGFDFADMNYTNDNYDAGVRCGRALGEWINETFGEDYNIKIGQSTYDQIPEVTQRTDGQIDGLTEVHPNFELVATDHPTDSSTAMSETENMLTANPDIEALFCWGDSMALGTLEAVRSMGYDESKFGIVSVDGTDEAVAEIAAGSALKMSCSLGGPIVQGDQQFDMMKEWIAGTNEDHYYSPNITITYKNVEEYLAGGEVSTEAE